MHHNLFSVIGTRHIKTHPFPYAVVQNAFPTELVNALRDTLPTLSVIGGGRQGLLKGNTIPNNQKLRLYGTEALDSPHVSKVWKDFISAHISDQCTSDFLSLFREHILYEYPHLSQFLRSESLTTAPRHTDAARSADVKIDAEITADTPVTQQSTVKGIHLDSPLKIGVAMYYLREQKNDSRGGAFQIYAQRSGYEYTLDTFRIVRPGFEHAFELVDEIPYADNTLLFFLNTPRSFHGVSERFPTTYPRHAFNLAIELQNPLFNLESVTHRPLGMRVRMCLHALRKRIVHA